MVKNTLEDIGIRYTSIELGIVLVEGKVSADEKSRFAQELLKIGLELIEKKKNILVEKIKNIVIELVHFSEMRLKKKYSVYIAEKLNYTYSYLSNLFSKTESTTIEKFIIKEKIERVKKLLIHEELTLTEISYQLQYSSVAHLSAQFKKVTGFNPTTFKRLYYRPN